METFLKHHAGKKIIFAGIGNVLKRDDGVGVYITNHLAGNEKIQALTTEVSIENYIGKINAMHPDILILVDSMALNKPPGAWKLFPADVIVGHTTNTHNISLDKISELFHCKTYILGIQPENITFGESLSPKVRESADQIIEEINSCITCPEI